MGRVDLARVGHKPGINLTHTLQIPSYEIRVLMSWSSDRTIERGVKGGNEMRDLDPERKNKPPERKFLLGG